MDFIHTHSQTFNSEKCTTKAVQHQHGPLPSEPRHSSGPGVVLSLSVGKGELMWLLMWMNEAEVQGSSI